MVRAMRSAGVPVRAETAARAARLRSAASRRRARRRPWRGSEGAAWWRDLARRRPVARVVEVELLFGEALEILDLVQGRRSRGDPRDRDPGDVGHRVARAAGEIGMLVEQLAEAREHLVALGVGHRDHVAARGDHGEELLAAHLGHPAELAVGLALERSADGRGHAVVLLGLGCAHHLAEPGDPVDVGVADVPHESEGASRLEHPGDLARRRGDVDPVPCLGDGDERGARVVEGKVLAAALERRDRRQVLRESLAHQRVGLDGDHPQAAADERGRELARSRAEVDHPRCRSAGCAGPACSRIQSTASAG